jgi:hypothetical protein
MTIAEMPRQAIGAGRPLGREFCFRFFPPSPLARLWRNPITRRTPPAAEQTRLDSRSTRRDSAERAASAVTDSMPLRTVERTVSRADRRSNATLESVAGGALAARFHAWHGSSGQRYVCSVFPVDAADADAGLPDFTEAVVIAAACEGDGTRRLVALRQCETGANPYARESFIIEALAAGASEWHVHLLASDVTQRRAAMADIDAIPRSRRACGRSAASRNWDAFKTRKREKGRTSKPLGEPFKRRVVYAEFGEMRLGVADIVRVCTR